MKRSTFSLLFIAKKHKLLRNGEAPIYLRITINGEISELAVKRSVDPDFWDSNKGCSTQKKQEGKELNYYLEQTKHKLFEVQKDLEFEGIEVTAKSVKDRYLGIDSNSTTLIKAYIEHNEDMKKMIGKGVAFNTHKRHDTSLRHTLEFLKEKYKRSDINFKEITPKFIKDYEVFLRTTRGCNQNSTVKYIRNLGKIIRIGLNNGWMRIDPFANLTYKTIDVDKPYLTQEELETVINKKINIYRIEQVRDIFLFCCFTGLAFVDVSDLTESDIITGIDGKRWIKKQRHKTGNWCHIPLLPLAKQILKKYENHPGCQSKNVLLPVISNQKMNAYLKEIGDLCGIEKELTTHVARHTFATTVTLTNKVSMEAVSKMLGHSTLQMTKKYARIVEDLISNEMDKVPDIY
ncbi:MAG: site-specific integrase [Bacteroidales bacterium]